jgi:signal transduction histidine kinase
MNQLDVLVVDDVKENLVALNALLSCENLNIYLAKSGSEALELMMQHDFGLALLDVQMPEMDGFELAELMRGSNKTKNIPIIFVTAASKHSGHIFKGYESGAVDFLIKPLNAHIVKSKVNVFLKLHQQKIELKQQVEQLNQTKHELELAVGVREEFMSIAGHELKTPLTSLKLQSQMRLRNLDKGSSVLFTPVKLLEMFNSDNIQIGRLTRIIDDMLDISRIRSGKLSMKYDNFDLCALVTDILENHKELFKTAGIQTRIDFACDSIIGNWDKFRIEQVITNLFTNAIRYGAKKPVEIRVHTELDRAFIIIEDKGIGIAKKDLKRIFQRFERATGSEDRGLGLGLYIVTQIIEAHKGLIKVESHQGEGSIFTIELPINL